MKEVQAILIATILFGVVMFGGTVVLTGFSGSAPDTPLPGMEASDELQTRVNVYVTNFTSVAEQEGGIGFLGLAGAATTVLWDMPSHAGAVIRDTFRYLQIPSELSTAIIATLVIIAAVTAVLIFRGVKG